MVLPESQYANETDSELIQRIKAKNWSSVRTMLESKDAASSYVTVLDQYGNSALHTAIGYKAPDDILLNLIKIYPDACKIHGTDEWLPVHVAALWGPSKIVMETLIKTYPQGLDDAGQSNEKGRTPRHYSARYPHIRELLERSTEDWISIIESEKEKK